MSPLSLCARARLDLAGHVAVQDLDRQSLELAAAAAQLALDGP
jgi:hypothetical protein